MINTQVFQEFFFFIPHLICIMTHWKETKKFQTMNNKFDLDWLYKIYHTSDFILANSLMRSSEFHHLVGGPSKKVERWFSLTSCNSLEINNQQRPPLKEIISSCTHNIQVRLSINKKKYIFRSMESFKKKLKNSISSFHFYGGRSFKGHLTA